MNRFIWIKDSDGHQHYVNVDHIIRVTQTVSKYTYILLRDANGFSLGESYDDIIAKIMQAQS